MTERLGSRVQLVGDDLFDKYQTAVLWNKAWNSKCNPDQGKSDRNHTESLEAVELAARAGYRSVISPPLR